MKNLNGFSPILFLLLLILSLFVSIENAHARGGSPGEAIANVNDKVMVNDFVPVSEPASVGAFETFDFYPIDSDRGSASFEAFVGMPDCAELRDTLGRWRGPGVIQCGWLPRTATSFGTIGRVIGDL